MNKKNFRLFILLSYKAALFLQLTACSSRNLSEAYIDYKEAEMAQEALWIITGKIADPAKQSGKMIAANINGNVYITRITDGKFQISVPGNSTYAIHFKTKFSSTSKKSQLSTFSFEDSPDIGLKKILTLPSISESQILNLGEIDIINENAFSSINPATTLDFDGDGEKDFSDLDDQNDDLFDGHQQNELEFVDICHYDKTTKTFKTVNISLTQFYQHYRHKDKMGSCE